jgi:oligosaccharide reducing-end xylanase
MINDDDDGTARDAKLSWNSATDNAYKDASLFGVGVLMDQQLVTSLEDTQLMHFSVYPNPATDLITVDGLDGEFDYQLFDNTGKVLQSGNAINSIQLESLTTGIYFLGLSQNTKTRTVKVIVK